MRSGYEEAVATRLEDWIAGDEDDADAFLRAWLKKSIAKDGRIDPAALGSVEIQDSQPSRFVIQATFRRRFR